jgi:heme-degrading monooxygenase HmoA
VNTAVTGADALVNEPVTLINAWTVPLEESERFLRWWQDNAWIMAEQPGFVRGQLYRSLNDDVDPRFINVAEWNSWKDLDEARANPRWLTVVQRMLDDPDMHFTPRPVAYQVVIDVRANHQATG